MAMQKFLVKRPCRLQDPKRPEFRRLFRPGEVVEYDPNPAEDPRLRAKHFRDVLLKGDAEGPYVEAVRPPAAEPPAAEPPAAEAPAAKAPAAKAKAAG